MIDPTEYATVKACNNVILTYDGISTFTATINQYDPNTGLPAQSPLIETCTLADVQNAIIAATAPITALENTMSNFKEQLRVAQTNLNNLQMLQADLIAISANAAQK